MMFLNQDMSGQAKLVDLSVGQSILGKASAGAGKIVVWEELGS